jgi:hypothetical protein
VVLRDVARNASGPLVRAIGQPRLRWRLHTSGSEQVAGLVLGDSGGCLGARRGAPRGCRPQRPGARPKQGCRRRRSTDHGIPRRAGPGHRCPGSRHPCRSRRPTRARCNRPATGCGNGPAGGRGRSPARQRGRAQWEGTAAAERHHARMAAMIERRYLPSFGEADILRLGVTTPAGEALWLDAYESSSSETEDHYRLEAAYWLTPLPVDGLLTLVCAWPEIGLPETRTDIILPDLAVRAAETFPFRCGISQRTLKPSRLRLRTVECPVGGYPKWVAARRCDRVLQEMTSAPVAGRWWVRS